MTMTKAINKYNWMIRQVLAILESSETKVGAIMKEKLYRVVPSPMTGIGWYSVQKWNGSEYKHLSTFRSESMAYEFIQARFDKEYIQAVYE